MPGNPPIRIPANGWKTVPTTAEPVPPPVPRPPSGSGSGLPLPGGDVPFPPTSQPKPGRYWLRDPYWKKAPIFPGEDGGFMEQPKPGPMNQRMTDPIHPNSPYTWGDIASGDQRARDDIWDWNKRRQNSVPDWLEPLPSPVEFPPGTIWRVKFAHPDGTAVRDFFAPIGGAAAFPSVPEDLSAFQAWQYIVYRSNAAPYVDHGNYHSGKPTISITVIPPSQPEQPYEPIQPPVPIQPPLDYAPAFAPAVAPGSIPSPAFAPAPAPGFQPFAEPATKPVPSPIPIEPNPGPGPLAPIPRPAPAPAPVPRPNPDRRSPVPGDRDYGKPAPGKQPPSLPSGKPAPTGVPFPLPLPDLRPVPVPYPVPIPEPVPDPGSGSGDDCTAVLQLVKELVRRSRQQECNCCEIENVTVSIFDGCDSETGLPLFKDMSLPCLKGTEAQITKLFDELAELRARECFSSPKNVAPSVLDSDQSTIETRTFYVSIPSQVRSVFLIITGVLPNSLSLYQTSSSGEAQAKFGNIAHCVESPAGGWAQVADPGWIWTRRTFYQVPQPRLETRGVRLNLQPGLSWVLYDSGER